MSEQPNGSPLDELWDPERDEEVTRNLPPDFYEGLLPDTDQEDLGDTPLSRGQFLYIGKGLKADEFTAYVESYDFGSQPPNFVVLHHTAIPDASWASAGRNIWDKNEAGKSEEQIYQKRLGQLTGIKNYYQNQLGWSRGPHLFIDEHWIWLFTPMYYQGIHAAAGNGSGANYSIGIEVVGHHTSVRWPAPVEELVGHAVAVLKRKLNTFEIVHKPFSGGVSSHRDYNKPSCPGDAVSNSYYIGVLQKAWERLQSGGSPVTAAAAAPVVDTSPTEGERLDPFADAPPTTPITEDTPLLGEPTGSIKQAVSYIKKNLSDKSEYKNDVDLIMGYYWKYALPVGVDPFIAACQCIFETDSLRSDWAARPKRNPAGLGVRQEGGLSFETWEDAVQAHIGQLLAFALRDDEANDSQRATMAKNPRHGKIGAELRGTAKTLKGLNNRWTSNDSYATGLVNRAKSVRGG